MSSPLTQATLQPYRTNNLLVCHFRLSSYRWPHILVSLLSWTELSGSPCPSIHVLMSLLHIFYLGRVFFSFPFLWQYQGLNLGPWLARQMLYHLNHTFCSLCFSYFSGRVSHFLPGLARDQKPLPLSASCIARITNVHYYSYLICFFLCWL
jgi:hypothetical protein